jgi:hypothetical protein
MADTGPRGPQGPAGTSIDLPVAIANGGTGATTAAGARANLGLGDLACVTHELAPSSSASFTFGAVVNALIVCTGTSGKSYGAFVYCGYGTGGTDRVHIAELQRGVYVSCSINEQSNDNTNGFTITNSNETNTCYVSVLTLRGGHPVITAL